VVEKEIVDYFHDLVTVTARNRCCSGFRKYVKHKG